MDERRRYVRLDTRLKIIYTVLEKEKDVSVASETKDISGGGIRIFLSEPVPNHALLKLTIHLPDDPQPIVCSGKVVWVEEFVVLPDEKRKEKNQYEAGVTFTDINPKDRDCIIKYVILGYAAPKK